MGMTADWEKLPVAPEVLRTLLYLFPAYCPGYALIIVGNFEGAETEFAYIYGLNRIFPAAFSAFQAFDMSHNSTSPVLKLIFYFKS